MSKRTEKAAGSPGSGKPARKRSASRTVAMLQAGVLIGLAFLLYGNTIGGAYVMDDGIVVMKNKFTQQGLKGIPDIMTNDAFAGFFGERKDLVAGGRYRPLSIVTFAVEQEIFGGNPAVSHAFNILLYGLTGVALLFVLRRWLGGSVGPGGPWWSAVPFIAAALFIAHPVHTEAVANIKGRDEILCLLLCLAAVALIQKYLAEGNVRYAVLYPVVFFLALLSKENAATFLAVIPLALWFFTNAGAGKIITIAAPLALATALFLFMRSHFAGGASTSDITEVLNNAFVYATPSQKYATICSTLGKYFGLLLLPLTLTSDYYYNQVPLVQWDDPAAVIPLLVTLALFVIAVAGIRSKRAVSFSILYYFLTLSVVTNIFFPVGTTMSERFLYMPSVGFVIVLALLIARAARMASPSALREPAAVTAVLLVAVAGSYSYRTVIRNPAWKSNLALFSADVVNSPNSAKVHNALGSELIELSKNEKDPSKKKAMLEEARPNLSRAVEIYPGYAEPWFSLGNIYYEQDRNYARAIECYRKAVAARPGYTDAYKNIGITYMNEQKYDDAIAAFRRLIAVDPRNEDAYYHIGVIHLAANRVDSAIAYLRESIALNPSYAPALNSLGMVYGKGRNDLDAAITYLRRAVAADPSNIDGYNNLGTAYGLKGDVDGAIGVFTKALEVDPGNAQVYMNLGFAYRSKGDETRAGQYFRRAHELNPAIDAK